MLAVQHRLPLVRPRMRNARRPFRPSQDTGTYRLPHEVRDRLASSLAPFRNRDAAFALAVFLARFWSAPGRIVGSFPIDRRALANRQDLGLTEKRVRSAIRTLEEIGFLDRAIPPSGSKYKPTPDGCTDGRSSTYSAPTTAARSSRPISELSGRLTEF